MRQKKCLFIVKKFINVFNMNVPCMSICNISIRIISLLMKMIITHKITLTVKTQSYLVIKRLYGRFKFFQRFKIIVAPAKPAPYVQVQNYGDALRLRHAKRLLQNALWSDSFYAWQNQTVETSGPVPASAGHGSL